MTQSRLSSKDLTMEIFARELEQGYSLEDIAHKYDIPYQDAVRMENTIRMTEYSAVTGNAIISIIPEFMLNTDFRNVEFFRYNPRGTRDRSDRIFKSVNEAIDHTCPGEVFRVSGKVIK